MQKETAPNVNVTQMVVARNTCCECFARRRSLLSGEDCCWFCKYAWFDLDSSETPEKGICKYPERQTN